MEHYIQTCIYLQLQCVLVSIILYRAFLHAFVNIRVPDTPLLHGDSQQERSNYHALTILFIIKSAAGF